MRTYDGQSEGSWFSNPDALVAELQQGEFAPQRAPILAGFENLQEIGRGGQAIVYVGVQRSTKRRVAVKVLLNGHFSSSAHRRRFEREIELVASLRHPNVVSVHDSGASPEGYPFCVMEYIEGVPLDEYVAELDLRDPAGADFRQFLALFRTICDAVHYAHQRGIIHRDLKPSNIRIDRDGQPHILDFGLAKNTVGESAAPVTATSITGQFVGSLAWASPEQTRGEPGGIDIRTDVYSLGLILYHALTTKFPYRVTGNFQDILNHIQTSDPERPRAHHSRLDEDTETIILKSLSKEPERRYQMAGELSADISRYLAGEPVMARGDSAWYAIRKTIRRHRTVTLVTLILFVSAVLLSIVMTFLYRRASDAELSARREVARASAVTGFLENMLASVSPDEKGRDVSVRAILDEAENQLDSGLANQQAVRASLHEIIGKTYRGLGEYAKAEIHLTRAGKMFRDQLGPNNERTLATDGELSQLYIELNKLDEAESLIESVLSRARASLSPDHLTFLRAESGMARLRNHQDRWSEAEQLYKTAIEKYARVLGEDSPETLSTISNYARVLHSRGAYQEAEALHRRVLKAQLARDGKKTPASLNTMGNIAAVLNSVGRLEEAEALLHEQIDDAMKVWGPEYRTTLSMQSNLVFNLRGQKRFEEAIKLALEILPIDERVLGPDHTNTIQALSALSALYFETKQYEKALPFAQRAYETSRRISGERHTDTLTAMQNLASVLEPLGKLDEAEELKVRNLTICRELYSPDHPDLAWPMNDLALMMCQRGKSEEALTLFTDAIRIVRKGLPPDHYFLPWLLYNRGSCLKKASRFKEAEKDLLECYQLYKAKGGDGHSDTQDSIKSLISVYQAAGRTEEAEKFRMLLTKPPSK